jgi:hypothetical protein
MGGSPGCHASPDDPMTRFFLNQQPASWEISRDFFSFRQKSSIYAQIPQFFFWSRELAGN